MLNFLIRTSRSDSKSPTTMWASRAVISAGVAGAAILTQLATWLAAFGDPMLGWLKTIAGMIYGVAAMVGIVSVASVFACILLAVIAERRERCRDSGDPLAYAALESRGDK